jgi:hypothetical protein
MNTFDELQDAGVAGLVAQLMQHSAQDNQYVLNQLVESYKAQEEELQAELDLIRSRIARVLYGPYTPASHVIEDLLWPERKDVELLAERRRKARK